MEPQTLTWARELAALAQNGLHFCQSEFDRQRYERIRAIAAELLAAGSGTEVETFGSILFREEGYATPKIDVRAGVFDDTGRILMVRERSDNSWSLPGGWADVTESAAEAAAKEVREESGYDVRPIKLAALLDKTKHPHPPSIFRTYKAFFLCELLGGSAQTSPETSEVEFFPVDQLPPLSEPRVTSGQVKMLAEHRRNPSRPTDFE